MRKKQKIKWKKGLAVVLAATVTATSTVSGNGKSILVVHAAAEGEETETTEGTNTETTGGNTSVENKELPEVIQPRSCGEGENAPTYTFIGGVLTFQGSGIVTTTDFQGCTNIKKVTAEDNCSITELPISCFEGCSGIEEVELSKLSGLTKIPNSCFKDCENLFNIQIPDSITIIEPYCFAKCNNLQSIIIPEKITKIGSYSFSNCSSLNSVHYKGSESSWKNIQEISYAGLGDVKKYYAKYKLTFDYSTNKGDSSTKEEIEVEANKKISLKNEDGNAVTGIPTASKQGWNFLGWNTNPSAENGLKEISVGESDLTLYAIFQKTLEANFIDSIEISNDNKTEKALGYIYNEGAKAIIQMPPLPERQGWNAIGWSTSNENKDTIINAEEEVSISRNTTYYAVYRQDVTVKYEAGVVPKEENESSESMTVTGLPSALSKERYCIGENYYIDPSFTLLQGITKSGYHFNYWKTENDSKQYAAGETVTINGNKTFIAVWTAEEATAKIISQPTNIEAVYGYKNASMQFQVEVADETNYELSYQWYEKTNDNNKNEISGAKSSRLSISTGRSAGIYHFYCEVIVKRKDNGKVKVIKSDEAIFEVEQAEQEIIIGNCDKIFDTKKIDETISAEVRNKENGTAIKPASLAYKYYKDSNGNLGNVLEDAPSVPGTYWVQVTAKGEGNYKAASARKQFTISYLPTPEEPYYILKGEDQIRVKNQEWYNDKVIIMPKDGYKIAKDSYTNFLENGIEVSGDGKQTIAIYLQNSNGEITDKISVPINIDTKKPIGIIQVKDYTWKNSISDGNNNIEFKYFLKDVKNAIISGEDEESGIESISYLSASKELTKEELEGSANWVNCTQNYSLPLSEEGKYIIYVKVTDKAGNVDYYNTEGMVFDNTAPVIREIIDHETYYYGEVSFEVEDTNELKSIKFGGAELLTGKFDSNNECIFNTNNGPCTIIKEQEKYRYTIKEAEQNGNYGIIVEDKAGNTTIIQQIFIHNQYTVTFKASDDDSDTSTCSIQKVKYQHQVSTPTNPPTKSGYVFAGWKQKKNNEDFDFSTKITEDLILIPKWTPASYQISFNSENGSTCGPIPVKYQQSVGALPTPTLTGYKFLGWWYKDTTTNQEQEIQIEKSTTFNFTDNITVYAKWKACTYEVSFDTGKGILSDIPQDNSYDANNILTVTYDQPYGNLPKAERAGYKFTGWYPDKNSVNEIKSTTIYKNTEDTTLYAQWIEADFNVTLDYNYGNYYNPAEIDSKTETIQVEYNNDYSILREKNPTFQGYTFDGWYTEAIGGRKIAPDEKVIIQKDSTLYAHWIPKVYTIEFDANKGSSCEKITVTYGDIYGTLPITERTGYQFNGWYLQTKQGEQGNLIKDTDKVGITENALLKAEWTPCTPEITLKTNGGTLAEGAIEKKISVIYDGDYTSLYTEDIKPTRIGYKFAGWYTEAEADKGIEIKETEQVKITNNTTLYAHWTANTNTITFNGNADNATIYPPENIGSDIYDNVNNTLKVTHDKTYGTLPTATRTGYKFLGWYTDSEAGEQITEKSKVDTTTENKTLYAHWIANKYTITFDKNTGNDITLPENTNNDNYNSADNTLKVTYDESYGILPTATKAGYKFDGWYTEAVNGTKFDGTGNANITDNITLYAHWIVNKLDFDSEFKTILKDAVYKEKYSAEIGKPTNGTGEYEYTLVQDSSLPIGLKLVENRIEGSLLENVREEPFTFKIKITDKNSKQSVEREFQIVSQKAEQNAPEAPQVITKTSNSVTLKNIPNIQYCVVEVKENEAEPSEENLEWKDELTFNKLEAGKTYNFYARWKEQTNYKASPKSEKTSIATLHVYNVEIPVVSLAEHHYKIVPVPESSKGLIKNADDNTKEEGNSIVQVEEGGSYAFKIEFGEGYNKTSDFVVYADGASEQEVITVSSNGLYIIKDITGDKKIAIKGVGDVSAPTGKITIEESSWTSFGRDVTFNRFYSNNKTTNIIIEGEDKEEGIQSISYYIGSGDDIKTESQIHANDDITWKVGTLSTVENNSNKQQIIISTGDIQEGKWVIYAKIIDTSKNSTYLRSDGIIIDNTKPTITAVSDKGNNENGIEVYETMESSIPFIIQDEYLKDVTIDGNPFYSFEGKYSVPADDASHTIIAKDQAGNETTLQVKVCTKKCRVSFGGGETKEVAYNQTVSKPSDPTQAGKIFYGWFLDGQEFDFNTRITEDITLEAKWLEAGSSTVSKPEEVSTTQTRVTLKQESGYKYRINEEQPVDNPVFTGLTPGKTYYFYKIDKEGNVSEPLRITTEGVSGATGMMALPSTIYQGDVYNIEPTVAMEGLINKSADPASAEVVWFVNKPDIVSITNESTKGCTISINQVPYQKNRLTRVTLTATVVYTQLKQGNLVTKKKSYKKSFNVQNLCNEVSVDLSQLSTEPASTGAFVSGSAICLMDKKGVSLKTIINRGAEDDIATNQKLKWFISDENGKSNSKGRKIASVNSKGVLKGIRPGKTYVTVATVDSYKKLEKSYSVYHTYEVICPWVTAVSFDNTIEKVAKAGSTLDLSSVLQCNPENVFNKEKMAKRWRSSDTKVARVTSKGKVTFRKAGTVTITCTPTGGQEISAATGKVSDTAKNIITEVTFTVQ